MDDESELAGGVANAGAVTRVGPLVLRPTNAHTQAIHRFLHHLAAKGFAGAPVPVGITDDGRERLTFIAGDVPLPPYPAWAQSDDALASIARLLRRFHRAAATFAAAPTDTWSGEMADPAGGRLVCHNDVCLENVVFRDGKPIALLDFDFAAPGRAVHDVASFARMCVPIDDDQSRGALGWQAVDLPRRLRRIADEYGLDAAERADLLDALDDAMARGGEFVRRRVEAGDANFIAMWRKIGGMARFDRRRAWWSDARAQFVAVLG